MNKWNDDIEKKIVEDGEKMGMTFKEEFWDEMENILDENEAIIPIVPLSGADHANSFEEGPFREEYWDEMSLILDKEDRRKRRAFFLRWSGDIASILLLTFLLIQPKDLDEVNSGNQPLFASEKNQKNTLSTISPKIDELKSTPEEISRTKRNQNDMFHSVQDTPGERLNNTNSVLNRMETVQNPPQILPLNKNLTIPTIDNEVPLNNDIRLDPKSLGSMDILTPRINSSTSSEVHHIRNRRVTLRPLSIRLFAASNISLAPKGNISDASRVGSSNALGIEVLKHQVNWSYSLGVNWTHRTGVNHELLLTRSTYGARLYREYQSVKYKSIGSIGIPVGVNYHQRRNVFGIKVTPTWNLAINSTYHRYNNYNSQELLVKNNYGIKEGINSFDMRLQFMYERRITERFAVGVNFSTGLLNQIDQELIPNTQGLREYSIGLNASYTLKSF